MSKQRQRKITVGVGVVVVHPTEKKVLITRRRKGIGKGCLSFPGGHIEEFEFASTTAIRETKEETGLTVWPNRFPLSTSFHVEERLEYGEHRITLYVATKVTGGTLTNREPDKHEDWQWVTLDEMAGMLKPGDWIPLPALLAARDNLGV